MFGAIASEASKAQTFASKPMLEWSPTDVCGWIDSLGPHFAPYRELFRARAIDGATLSRFTSLDLKEVGVNNGEDCLCLLFGARAALGTCPLPHTLVSLLCL